MDDVNRKKLNAEIERLHDKLKTLSPDGKDYEEYEKVSNKLIRLTELANKDDEGRRNYEIDKLKLENEASIEASKQELEREKLDAQANIEASRRGLESEKAELEAQIRAQETKRSWIQFGISAGVTLFTFIGTWVANHISQNQSEYFEAEGHSYTSKFSKFQNKEPMHPNPLLRNK